MALTQSDYYDSASNVVYRTNRNYQTSALTYNVLGGFTAIQYNNATTPDVHRYDDDAGNPVYMMGDAGASGDVVGKSASGDALGKSAGDPTATLDAGSAGGRAACSFSAATPVATPTGERSIGRLLVGDTV